MMNLTPIVQNPLTEPRCGWLSKSTGLACLLMASAGFAAPTIQDFDNPGTSYVTAQLASAPAAEIVPGGPSGAFLRLTTNSNSILNTIAFDQSESGAWIGISADFDFRMGGGPFDGADGISFVLLDTANYGVSGALTDSGATEEPNLTGSFGMALDTWNNGLEDNNLEQSVSIHFDGSVLANSDVSASIDLENGLFDASQFWNHAHIEINQVAGGSEVTVVLTDGSDASTANAYTNYFIPGLNPYSARVAFAARTGGANNYQDIDNINVQYILAPPPSEPSPIPALGLLGILGLISGMAWIARRKLTDC